MPKEKTEEWATIIKKGGRQSVVQTVLCHARCNDGLFQRCRRTSVGMCSIFSSLLDGGTRLYLHSYIDGAKSSAYFSEDKLRVKNSPGAAPGGGDTFLFKSSFFMGVRVHVWLSLVRGDMYIVLGRARGAVDYSYIISSSTLMKRKLASCVCPLLRLNGTKTTGLL